MLHVCKALRLSKWPRSLAEMLQSVLHNIRPLLALFDLGQASHMGDPQAIRKDRARAHGTLQPPEANSKIDFCPSSWTNTGTVIGCGKISLAEGKVEELKMSLFFNNSYHVNTPALCTLQTLFDTFSKTLCKRCMKTPLISWEPGAQRDKEQGPKLSFL